MFFNALYSVYIKLSDKWKSHPASTRSCCTTYSVHIILSQTWNIVIYHYLKKQNTVNREKFTLMNDTQHIYLRVNHVKMYNYFGPWRQAIAIICALFQENADKLTAARDYYSAQADDLARNTTGNRRMLKSSW